MQAVTIHAAQRRLIKRSEDFALIFKLHRGDDDPKIMRLQGVKRKYYDMLEQCLLWQKLLTKA